jgi:hypothetical protein
MNYGLGLNLHSVIAGCSVACLEWLWWISQKASLALTEVADVYDETATAKEAKSSVLLLRKTPRLFHLIGIKVWSKW